MTLRRMQPIADRHGLGVIYDAAHAFGAQVDGQSIVEFGDASMMSFHATKLFQTCGRRRTRGSRPGG